MKRSYVIRLNELLSYSFFSIIFFFLFSLFFSLNVVIVISNNDNNKLFFDLSIIDAMRFYVFFKYDKIDVDR